MFTRRFWPVLDTMSSLNLGSYRELFEQIAVDNNSCHLFLEGSPAAYIVYTMPLTATG